MMKQGRLPYSRRVFLGTAASAGLALLRFPSQVLGANGDVRVAVIGLGNMGSSHVTHFGRLPGVRVVAVCDVDPRRLETMRTELSKEDLTVFCATDPRRILERNDVDVVVIATPNHWHALLAVWACEAGKDVYVEKPVSHNVWEGRQIVRAAKRHNRIVQTGTQFRSDRGLQAAGEYIRQGRLGKILWGHVLWYEYRPSIGRSAPYYPDWLDYDLYCGPAPLEPLTRPRLHYDWHWVWSTGGGDLANSGIHALDACRFMAGIEGLPPQVLGIGGRFGVDDTGQTPNTQLTVFDYRPVPILVENRNLPMKSGMTAMDQLRGVGEGMILQCEHGYFAGFRGGGTVFDNDGRQIEQFVGDGGREHAANFIGAVHSRKPEDLKGPIAEGHLSSMLCHLGNISYRLGRDATLENVKAAVSGCKLAEDTLDRLQQHLNINGVDLNKTPLRLGPRLALDALDEDIAAVDGSDTAEVLQAARSLVRGYHRAPLVIEGGDTHRTSR